MKGFDFFSITFHTCQKKYSLCFCLVTSGSKFKTDWFPTKIIAFLVSLYSFISDPHFWNWIQGVEKGKTKFFLVDFFYPGTTPQWYHEVKARGPNWRRRIKCWAKLVYIYHVNAQKTKAKNPVRFNSKERGASLFFVTFARGTALFHLKDTCPRSFLDFHCVLVFYKTIFGFLIHFYLILCLISHEIYWKIMKLLMNWSPFFWQGKRWGQIRPMDDLSHSCTSAQWSGLMMVENMR